MSPVPWKRLVVVAWLLVRSDRHAAQRWTFNWKGRQSMEEMRGSFLKTKTKFISLVSILRCDWNILWMFWIVGGGVNWNINVFRAFFDYELTTCWGLRIVNEIVFYKDYFLASRWIFFRSFLFTWERNVDKNYALDFG